MDSRRFQTWLLIAVGIMELGAFAGTLMPRRWMEATHQTLGMGTMPVGPLVDYMIRQASFVYGMMGVAHLVMARDVVRFRPLVLLTGWFFLIGAPLFVAIDFTSGMPTWWAATDGLVCFTLGALFLSSDRWGRAAGSKN